MSDLPPPLPRPAQRLLQRPFNWLDLGLDWFERFILAGGIAVMAIVSIANVVSRNTLGISLQYAHDITQMLLVVVTFMGIGIGAREARHIRVSAIHDLLPKVARKVLLTVVGLITSVLLFALAGWAWDYVQATRRSCRILPETFAQLPLWLGVPLALGLMVLAGHLIRLAAEKGWPAIARLGPLKRNLVLLAGLAAALVIGALLFGLFVELVDNRTGRCRITPSTGLPVYLIYMVVPLGFLLGGFQFLLAAVRNLISRDNYLSWYQLDEYQSEAEALGLAASMGADVEPEPNRGRPDG